MPLSSLHRSRFLAAALAFTLVLSSFALSQDPLRRSRPAPPRRQNVVGVQTSPQLFSTLAALDAAGFEAGSGDASSPLRRRLRPELLKLDGPAARALRDFFQAHTLPDSGATQSRYVSFALLAGPPPDFTITVARNYWPADVVNLDGFAPILAGFYQEAGLERIWKSVQPDYEQSISNLQKPIADIVLRSSGYVRELLDPSRSRYFTVYVEPMIGNRIQFRNDGDQYSLVINPGSNPPLGEIQHSFLHFLLDPIVLKNAGRIRSAEPLLRLAARSPRLSPDYQYDLPGFFAECLVRAAEIRLSRMPAATREAEITKAERDGFVLLRSLDSALAAFEKSEPSMGDYFTDLVRSIPVADEAKRLQTVDFSAAQQVQSALPAGHLRTQSELQRWLTEADRLIASNQNKAAVEAFQRILEKYPDTPRAMYGLAIASISVGDVVRAKQFFQAVVHRDPRAPDPQTTPPEKDPLQTPDPSSLAWSHVYLGRIYDMEGQRDLAVSEYKAALVVNGAPEPARIAAQEGVRKPFERPPRAGMQP